MYNERSRKKKGTIEKEEHVQDKSGTKQKKGKVLKQGKTRLEFLNQGLETKERSKQRKKGRERKTHAFKNTELSKRRS